MRRELRWCACAMVLAILCLGVVAAKDGQTLTGRYVWSATGEGGDLEAVFTSAGEGKWNVDFRFHHSGEERIYSGTAEGSLSGGEVRGKVSNEGGGRQFTFRMQLEDGKFRGTHAELTGGREQPTGTLSLG